jgi:uncharacterized membrane protein
LRDSWWMHVLLSLHILSGAGAFVLAPLALVTAKGGRAHRRWGKIYFWCMAGVASTALIMAIWLPILFLALIAIFSFYTAFGAYRVLGQKAAWKSQSVVTALDWAAAILCVAACAALILCGFFRPELIQNLRIPAIVFGLVGLRISARAIWRFTHPPAEKMFWWYIHLQGMIGSYIAAWTAFCLVTLGPLLHGAWWLWLAPISVGLPAILVTTAYYRQKFRSRPEPALQEVSG